MKLYIYRDGLCDPAKNFGLAKQFGTADDLDAFLNFFVVSIKPDALFHYRAFITNDEVEWDAIDHFSLHGEPLGLVTRWTGKIEEVPVAKLFADLQSRLPKTEIKSA